MKKDEIVPVVQIESRILEIRGQKVMIDADLADIYGVPTKALNQAVKRNLERFPRDFMFQLTKVRKKRWSQTVTTSRSSNFHRFFPMYSRNTAPLWRQTS